ncbi:MAG: VOC family protein [Gordonia sp. (in: high G+C Gram-positive bacteria)]
MTCPTLNALSVVVAEMAATVAFYRRLGLEFPDDAASSTHTETRIGGLRLMFDTRDVITSFMPDWTPPTGGHAMALAVECACPAAVDACHGDLVDAGHRSIAEPFDAVWGQRYAIVADPDGNPVDLYCPL